LRGKRRSDITRPYPIIFSQKEGFLKLLPNLKIYKEEIKKRNN